MDFKEFEKEMKIRGFTPQTIESYLFHNYKFLKFIGKSPRDVNADDVKQYLYYLVEKRKAKPRTINLAISALKFYYEQFSNKKLFSRIRRSKEEKLLPRVLSKEEIVRMINVTKNLKHKLLIELMYSSGLRVSECVRLKINDIDAERKVGIVNRGKGKKDRLFLLSDKFLKDFQYYILNKNNKYGDKINNENKQCKMYNEQRNNGSISIKNNPNKIINNNLMNKNNYNKNLILENKNNLNEKYNKKLINEHNSIGSFNEHVFNDNAKGHITIRAAENIIKNAAKKAGINKRVHCHMIRASFATHLLEEKVPESYIQKLMGHESRKTLQRYLAVKVDEALKVKSPLDIL